jgi:hypothetical protein
MEYTELGSDFRQGILFIVSTTSAKIAMSFTQSPAHTVGVGRFDARGHNAGIMIIIHFY